MVPEWREDDEHVSLARLRGQLSFLEGEAAMWAERARDDRRALDSLRRQARRVVEAHGADRDREIWALQTLLDAYPDPPGG